MQSLSPSRVREVSRVPHPAEARALSPESVTPLLKSASTMSKQHQNNTTLMQGSTSHPQSISLIMKTLRRTVLVTQIDTHSRERERDVSRTPHPAEASAWSPASVTSSLISASPSRVMLTPQEIDITYMILDNHNVKIPALTPQSERGQLCATACRYKCTKSRVRHS